MAHLWPDWITSPTEWAVLRDQLNSTSHPSLSKSTQLSSFLLLSLCSLSLLLHPCSIWLRYYRSNPSTSHFTLGTSVWRYHQPNLSLLLPSIFFLHAILNIASISNLLFDANRLKFKGHTMAIQHINYSLLLSAGVLTAWALASGLPPMHIGVCAPSRNGARRTNDISLHPRKTLSPSTFNSIGYSSILITFLVPLPCILLITKFTNDINHLDNSLLVLINQILENFDQLPDQLIDQALKIINQLDQTSNLLFFHTRMLSAIHLFFTLIILSCSVLISASILRPIIRTLRNRSNNINQLRQFQKNHHRHHHQPTRNESDQSIANLKPALIVDSTRNNIIEPSYLERKAEAEEYGREEASNISNDQTDRNVTTGHTSSSFTLPIDLLSNTTVDQDQSKKLKQYSLKIKHVMLFVSISCLSFIVLNFCVVANLFKFPDEISIGDLSILKLEWSTWLWNGSMSPIIGFINCVLLLNKNSNKKWSFPRSIF